MPHSASDSFSLGSTPCCVANVDQPRCAPHPCEPSQPHRRTSGETGEACSPLGRRCVLKRIQGVYLHAARAGTTGVPEARWPSELRRIKCLRAISIPPGSTIPIFIQEESWAAIRREPAASVRRGGCVQARSAYPAGSLSARSPRHLPFTAVTRVRSVRMLEAAPPSTEPSGSVEGGNSLLTIAASSAPALLR